MSRGASSAIAVDSSRRNIAEIDKKAKEWNVPVKGVVGDAMQYKPDGEIDLVYADPPYDFDRYDDLVAAIEKLDPSLAAVEHRARTEVSTTTFLRRAEYGEVWITFFGRDR